MNTMKPILLGAALLALAGLCGRPVHADANFTATASGVTPQGGDNPIIVGYGGSNPTPASIPIKVVHLSVQVTGATPSSTVYVGWSMLVKFTVRTTSGSYAGSTLDQDTNGIGLVAVQTNKDGSWHRNWKGVADSTTVPPAPNFSGTLTTTQAGSWVVEADSTITDANGVPKPTISATGNFTTSYQYIV